MTALFNSLLEFWNGFLDFSCSSPAPIPAFHELAFPSLFHDSSSSPVPRSFPFISFNSPFPAFANSSFSSASIWTRSSSFSLLNNILDQVHSRIPESGTRIPVDSSGSFFLYRANPFFDFISDPSDPLIKGAVIKLFLKNYIV